MSDVKNTIEGEKPSNIEALKFIKVKDYVTFEAEYTIDEDGELTIHFFLPEELVREHSAAHLDQAGLALCASWMVKTQPHIHKYWAENGKFPHALQYAVEKVLHIQPPQVVASYTTELASWWLHALGFQPLDPDGLLRKFWDELSSLLAPAAKEHLVVKKLT